MPGRLPVRSESERPSVLNGAVLIAFVSRDSFCGAPLLPLPRRRVPRGWWLRPAGPVCAAQRTHWVSSAGPWCSGQQSLGPGTLQVRGRGSLWGHGCFTRGSEEQSRTWHFSGVWP